MRERLLAVARGDGVADLLLTGGQVVDVFTGSVVDAEIAVAEGLIASVGPARDAVEIVDVGGRFLLPGLIDAHVHLESAMVTPYEFARAVVPRGTTAVVTDPHEVANVAGLDGVRWLLDASQDLPLAVLVMAPSCVPATHLATTGGELDAADLEELAGDPRIVGLAEVMNVPGVVLGDAGVHAKLEAFSGRPVDGHGPGQILTEHLEENVCERDGELVAEPVKGISKLAVIERHRGTGNVGLGFLRGFGPLEGALACTIAHDHHNLIVAGGDDRSMHTAIEEIVRLGGGAVVTRGETVMASLPLPYAGLISDRPLAEVRAWVDELNAAAGECGCTHPDPLMALSFAALEVIPSLKLTDLGLVDVESFRLVSLAVC